MQPQLDADCGEDEQVLTSGLFRVINTEPKKKQNKEEVCGYCCNNRRGNNENKWEMRYRSTRFDGCFSYGQTGAFAELFVLTEANK